jgi:hypothetical protein
MSSHGRKVTTAMNKVLYKQKYVDLLKWACALSEGAEREKN